MNLLTVTLFALVFFFGLLAIALSLIEERTRKAMQEQNKLSKQKIFQISILKEIQDRIGYSLNTEEVIDVITGSLKHIFPYSASSSMVVKDDKIIFKTNVEENISHAFLENVKKSMIASLSALLPDLNKKIEEVLIGVPLDDTSPSLPSSFFHIPLVVNNRVVGLINLSSTKPNLYKEEEMTILYQITEQASKALTKLEQVLETEKGKLTSLISSLADGVFMLDNEKNILIINDSAKRFLRLNPPAGGPTFFDILSSFPKEFDLAGIFEKVTVNKLPVTGIEITLGQNIFQTFITPVVSSQSQTIGISVLLHDITLEKNLSRIKEDFTNMMVHELRAPLVAIKDSSELMLDSNKLDSDNKLQLLGIINSESKVLLEQIADLLDAAKIEAGMLTINKTKEDLGETISQTVKTFLPTAEKKGVTLSSKISPLPPLYFDKLRIVQVLNNLISNSLKFTSAGGTIEVEASVRGSSVEIKVKDSGIGIPKEKQEKLFSKFYQVEDRQHRGSGLGLYVTKGIIEAHNGKIGLQSEEGKGTTVSFTLPLSNFSGTSQNFKLLN